MKAMRNGMALFLLLSAFTLPAFGWTLFAEPFVGAVSMTHINESIESETDLGMGPVRVGAGVVVGADFLDVRGISLGAGARMMAVRQGDRETGLSGAMVGPFLSASYRAGSWLARVDVGGYGASYTLPASRVIALSGRGLGVSGAVQF